MEPSCKTLEPSPLIMKFLVILALVAFVAANEDAPKADYSRYENFDVSEMTENKRLLSSYSKCFVGSGKCTPEGLDFRTYIPGAIQSDCSGCSEHQKTLVARVMKAIKEKIPEDWVELDKKHNPDGKYTEAIKKFVDKYAQKD